MVLPLLGGLIVALLGAAIWAGVTYFTGWELGLIGWLIGVAVGAGVFALSDKRRSPARGAVAAGVACLGILTGKFAWTVLDTSRWVTEANAAFRHDLDTDDEYVISYIADEEAASDAQWDRVGWPLPDQFGGRFAEAHYPPELWAIASERWSAMDTAEQDQQRDDLYETYAEHRSAFELAGTYFQYQFTFWDILWFGLAMVSAFSIAAKGGDAPAHDPYNQFPTGPGAPPTNRPAA